MKFNLSGDKYLRRATVIYWCGVAGFMLLFLYLVLIAEFFAAVGLFLALFSTLVGLTAVSRRSSKLQREQME